MARGCGRSRTGDRGLSRADRRAGGADADAQSIYVACVKIAGSRHLLAASPSRRRAAVQALGNVVEEETAAPAIGARAFWYGTRPSPGGRDPKAITTARPRIRALRTSVAQGARREAAVRRHVRDAPYCQTRTCGPVVQIVQAVAKRWQKGVEFIHVEIYEDNDPAKGTNRWVDAWRLPTEPFTFVVDRTGVIRARLEGAFSTDELDEAVKGVAPTP
jgi:hypothetical protein